MLQTEAGFTILKTFLTLTVLGAVWGLLSGTRLLRGEEDAGRWELLLTGTTTRGRATAQAMGGLLAGVAVLWAVTAVIIVVAGRWSRIDIAAGAGLFFATALVSGALLFVAIGALTSQLGATRRRAAGYAGAVLGASYALRMVADSGTGLHWLVWCTPLGWVESLQPLTSPRPWPLVPIVVTTVVVGRPRRPPGRPPATSARAPSPTGTGPSPGCASSVASPGCPCASSDRPWWPGRRRSASPACSFGFVADAAAGSISGSSVRRRPVPPRGGRVGDHGLPRRWTSSSSPSCSAYVAAGLVTAARSEEFEGRLDPLLDPTGARGRTGWAPGSWWRWPRWSRLRHRGRPGHGRSGRSAAGASVDLGPVIGGRP